VGHNRYRKLNMALLAGTHFRPPDEVANKQARGQRRKTARRFSVLVF
jgi:hypothetical protein